MARVRSTSFLASLGLLATSTWLVTPAEAATRVVSNCNDSGPGSLRAVIAAAASDDTVDLSKLSCTRITLTSGALEIPQTSLTLLGRSRYALTIDGNRKDRVIVHTGSTNLRVEHLSIANGYFTAEGVSFGGCILSEGNVQLVRARVHRCVLEATPDPAEGQTATSGAGVHARGSILVSFSAVFYNHARYFGVGGGLRTTFGQMTLYRSQVYGNSAHIGGGASAYILTATYSLIHGNVATYGAGAHMYEGGLIIKSTVSNNHASARGHQVGEDQPSGGGLHSYGTLRIVDSTVSGNSAVKHGGAQAVFANVYNSTIAFNRDTAVDPETGQCGGALFGYRIWMESTIAARNICDNGTDWDIGAGAELIVGGHNLIGRSQVPIPADTISLDPRLGALSDNNGGPTRTHMLLSDSPAIDRGSNVLNRQYDQRGPGFPRVKGGFPDIGAIER